MATSKRDPFHSPKSRLARAKANIANLEAGARTFIESKPDRLVTEFDAENNNTIIKIVLCRPLPDDLSQLAFEVVEALRSVLDQTGFATSILGGCSNPKNAYFPIANSAAELENLIRGRCKDVPTPIVALFRTFQPYKGGNDPVWALNQMSNASKHRFIVPVGMPISQINVGAGGISLQSSATGSVRMLIPKWDSTKDEIVMFIVEPGGKIDYDFSLSYQIAFGEVYPVEHCGFFSTTGVIVNTVERIMTATEAECRRLSFIP